MRIILCDDNKGYLDLIAYLIEKHAKKYNADVIGFFNGDELMEYCENHQFDIVYMDIEVGKKNGMDMAKILKNINSKALIIYISAFDCYYSEMVNAEPFRFIDKNCTGEDLEKNLANALEAAVNRIEGKDEWFYYYGRMNYSILRMQIKYFYSLGRKIHMVTNCEVAQDFYYGKLDDVEEELKKVDSRFIRISNRVIVNMVYAYCKGKNKIEINNKIFVVSPLYRDDFNERYKKYLKVKIC